MGWGAVGSVRAITIDGQTIQSVLLTLWAVA